MSQGDLQQMPPQQERIAIFTATMGGGGAERSMIRLASGLAERGYRTDLVLGCRSEDQHFEAEVSDAVRIIQLDAARALLSLPRLVRYLRRERPAAMVASLDYINVIALTARWLSRVGTRVVVNEQNTLSVETQHSTQWRHRLLPRLIRRTYPWADGITAVSVGVADDLARVTGLPRDRVRVIHNPVIVPELLAMTDAPCDHPWLKERSGVPVALAVGRFVQQKDFGLLLRAFSQVRRQREVRLLILGEGPERPKLEALVEEYGLGKDVDLPGFVINPYPYMARSDLFVLSSRWEGLPTVLIEALFCGVPIVATDCPSGPQEILDGGKFGTLVPVGDVDALAGAIVAAFDGRVPTGGPESWQRYDRQTVTSHYLDVLVGG